VWAGGDIVSSTVKHTKRGAEGVRREYARHPGVVVAIRWDDAGDAPWSYEEEMKHKPSGQVVLLWRLPGDAFWRAVYNLSKPRVDRLAASMRRRGRECVVRVYLN
jgi:hypothetical protein